MKKIYRYTILFFATAVMLYLTIAAVITTADMQLDGVSEQTTFLYSYQPIKVCLAIFLMEWVLLYIGRRLFKISESKLYHILLVYYFAVCMLWVVLSNTQEGADQAQVLYAAKAFAQGDFSKLAPDKYMGMFPYQLPLALLYEPFYILFGDVTPFLWQYINACLICGIQMLLYHLVRRFAADDTTVKLYLILQFLDMPLVLYVSFIYGTIIGLFLALLSILLLVKALDNANWLYGGLSAVCLAASCLLRTNYVIFLIAIWITLIFRAFSVKKYKALFFIPLSLVLFVGARQGIYSLYEYRSGMSIEGGVPFLLNIATGLSEGDERAAGWFNGYTWDTYLELDCDRDRCIAFAKERIAESLQQLSSPSYAVHFFTEKINSTWLNTDFQGLWNNEHHGHAVAYAPVVYNLFTGGLHIVSLIVLGAVQLMIYDLTLVALLSFWKSKKDKELLLMLVFLGGFAFHLFWETKAQYVIVYYVLLFPYAASGMRTLMKIRKKEN